MITPFWDDEDDWNRGGQCYRCGRWRDSCRECAVSGVWTRVAGWTALAAFLTSAVMLLLECKP